MLDYSHEDIEADLQRIPNVVSASAIWARRDDDKAWLLVFDIATADPYGKLSAGSRFYSIGLVFEDADYVPGAGLQRFSAKKDAAIAALARAILEGRNVRLPGETPMEWL